MALGTITPVVDTPGGLTGQVNSGALAMTVTNVVGSASYTTGGDALTPTQLGLSQVLFAQAEVFATTGSNNVASNAVYLTSGKLQQFTTGTTGAVAEVSSAGNVSGITWQIIAWGQK